MNTLDFEKTVYATLTAEPFYSFISRHISKVADPKIPTTGVSYRDGRFQMRYNPEFMGGLDEKARKGVLIHEFNHIVLGHLTTRILTANPANHYAANVAYDLADNSFLGDYFSEEMKKSLCFPGIGSFKDYPPLLSAEQYWEMLPRIGGSGGEGGGKGKGKLLDEHNWGSEVPAEVIDSIIDGMVAGAAQEAASKGWGTVPNHVRDDVLARIGRAKVRWQKLLEVFVRSTCRADVYRTVRRINKRYPYTSAGKRTRKTAKLLLAIDESGSVSDQLVAKFFVEIERLSEFTDFDVLPFDSAVCEAGLTKFRRGFRPQALRRRTCGGTDFNAPTRWVNDRARDYDGLIILTDMEAPKPERCKVQRIWITDQATPYFQPDERVIILRD